MADTKEPVVATVKEKKPSPDPNAYPKWRYHASLPAIVVQDKADEDARTPSSDGWSDTVAEPAPAKPPVTPLPAVKKPVPPAPTK